MDSGPWSAWSTVVDWGACAGAPRERLEAFLGRVLPAVDRLATTIDGGQDMDVLAALSADLELLGVAMVSDAEQTARAIHDWACARGADQTAVSAWWLVVQDRLEADALPVQFLAVVILLERIARAVIVSRPELDPEGLLLAAADLLAQSPRTILIDVLTGRISASTYRVM